MNAVNLAARQAAQKLQDATPEALLDTYAALTHRIHAAERVEGVVAADVRIQRDMVRAEILERMTPPF